MLRVLGQPGLHSSRPCLKNKHTGFVVVVVFLRLQTICILSERCNCRNWDSILTVKEHAATADFTTKIFIIITTESLSSINRLFIPLSPTPPTFLLYRLGRGRTVNLKAPSGGPASHFASFVSRSREHIPSTRWKVAERPAPASPAFCSGLAPPPPFSGPGRRARAAGSRGGGAVARSTHPARSLTLTSSRRRAAGRGRDGRAEWGGGAPPAPQRACAVGPPAPEEAQARPSCNLCSGVTSQNNPLGDVGRAGATPSQDTCTLFPTRCLIS